MADTTGQLFDVEEKVVSNEGVVRMAWGLECGSLPTVLPKFWEGQELKTQMAPVRNSARSMLHECPRKYMLKERLGLRTREYEKALWIGSAFHTFLYEVYKGMPIKNLDTVSRMIVQGFRDQITPLVDKIGLLPNRKTLTEQMSEVEKDVTSALAMAITYFHYLPVEPLLRTYTVTAQEQTFEVRLPGIEVPLIIQPDLVLERKDDPRKVYIVDHKTCQVDTSIRAAVCTYEFQARFYRFVLQRHFDLKVEGEKKQVVGVIHNIIRKPSIRQKKNQTFPDYVKEVGEWYETKNREASIDPKHPGPPILQSIVRHVGPTLDEETAVQIYNLAQAGTRDLVLGQFPRNEASCFGKFNNSACPYIGLCRSQNRWQKEWPGLLKQFKQEFRPWTSDDPDDSND